MVVRVACFVIGMVVATVFFNYNDIVPNFKNDFYTFKNSYEFIGIERQLNILTANILEETNSDMVYVWLFHENPESQWFSKFVNNVSPAYASAVYIKTDRDIPNPIQNRQNMPLLSITRISVNLEGECASFVTQPNHSSNSEDWSPERLQVRCPIFNRRGQIIGAFGISKVTNPTLDALKYAVPNLTKILQDYQRDIGVIFN